MHILVKGSYASPQSPYYPIQHPGSSHSHQGQLPRLLPYLLWLKALGPQRATLTLGTRREHSTDGLRHCGASSSTLHSPRSMQCRGKRLGQDHRKQTERRSRIKEKICEGGGRREKEKLLF